MKKLLILAILLIGYNVYAQQPATSNVKQSAGKSEPTDLTGTWEGEFIQGTIGLRQPSKMVLEIVQVEGKLICIVDIYPVDTRDKDHPNITYTFEGPAQPEKITYSLIQGRVVQMKGSSRFDVVQFLFQHKDADSAETLAGRWFRHLEPLNSRERGSGTFTVKRMNGRVSDRLKLPRQQKEILEKLDKQDQATR